MLRAMKSNDPFRARLTVENLGAIERAEMTIRPLTLFFGPNGTNKTWAAYALYGLLRRFRSGFAWTEDIDPALVAEGDEALAHLIRQFELRPDAFHRTSLVLPRPPSLSRLSGPEIAGVLALKSGVLDSAGATLDTPLSPSIPESVPVDIELDAKTTGQWSYEFDREAKICRVTTSPDLRSSRHLLSVILGDMLRVGGSTIAFPAERKALLTLHQQLSTLSVFGRLSPSAVAADAAHLGTSLVDERLRTAAHALEASLPQPSMNFVRYIDNLWHLNPDFLSSPVEGLAETLEGILGGRLDFEKTQTGVGRSPHLRFRVGDIDLPVHSSHSLARSLGGVGLYLRDSARVGDFVFIDEPEMNAHPETQVAIAELMALMVNAGLRVVATTHSPYIIDHLHNLIEAERLQPDAQARFAERFKLKTADAFIAADKVAAYHFGRDGMVSDVFDRDDRVIDWSILGDDADDIANLYSELLGAQLDE